jgi:hypothetical protein
VLRPHVRDVGLALPAIGQQCKGEPRPGADGMTDLKLGDFLLSPTNMAALALEFGFLHLACLRLSHFFLSSLSVWALYPLRSA